MFAPVAYSLVFLNCVCGCCSPFSIHCRECMVLYNVNWMTNMQNETHPHTLSHRTSHCKQWRDDGRLETPYICATRTVHRAHTANELQQQWQPKNVNKTVSAFLLRAIWQQYSYNFFVLHYLFFFYQLTAITLTNVVLPEYCRPTSVNSISSFQNRLLNQSNILFIIAIIFD